jgi:predicted secreted protein
MTANTEQGKSFVLSISQDSGTTYLIIGGINTKSYNVDNAVTDTTNQATPDDITESAFNGYSQPTINGSGVIDTRSAAGSVATVTLATAANSGDRSAYLQLEAADGEKWEGQWNITSFSKNAEQQGQVEFSMTAQPCIGVTYTAGT